MLMSWEKAISNATRKEVYTRESLREHFLVGSPLQQSIRKPTFFQISLNRVTKEHRIGVEVASDRTHNIRARRFTAEAAGISNLVSYHLSAWGRDEHLAIIVEGPRVDVKCVTADMQGLQLFVGDVFSCI